MKSKEFLELFESRITEGVEFHSPSTLLLLKTIIINDDITDNNYLDIKGKLAIKLIISGVDLTDSLSALKVFDDIVDEFVLIDKIEKKGAKMKWVKKMKWFQKFTINLKKKNGDGFEAALIQYMMLDFKDNDKNNKRFEIDCEITILEPIMEKEQWIIIGI